MSEHKNLKFILNYILIIHIGKLKLFSNSIRDDTLIATSDDSKGSNEMFPPRSLKFYS